MLSLETTISQQFQRNESGSVAVIFGTVLTAVVMFVGLAIDTGRAVHSNSRLSSAIDSAALAAAKGIRLEGLSDAAAIALAKAVFNDNMASTTGRWTDINSITVTLDRATSTAQVNVDASVKTVFASVLGLRTIPLPKSGTAVFDLKDIEVSVQLDLTGSMCNPCSKIAALRTATADLLDILLPDGGTPNKVRVALAPFAQSVNAGALAAAVSNHRSTDGCVYESNAANPNTDDAPTALNYLKVAGDPGVTSSKNLCPPGPKVIPLSTDKAMLQAEVASYATYNSTAGHLGTAWTWYMLSPKWASLLPAASHPVAYGDDKTRKVAILMTDGVYNSVGGVPGQNVGALATDSQSRAKAMCDNMKAQGITVYTVGFDIAQIGNTQAEADAIKTLTYCASSPTKFYQATNSAELSTAFHSIATNIMTLRLSR